MEYAPTTTGMTYGKALTALVDQQFAGHVRNSATLPEEFHNTRDEYALGNTQIRIAADVFGEMGISDELYDEIRNGKVTFGTFDNCREYGLTVTAGDWTFCAYKHRNSDDIQIEGCLTSKIRTYGPYGDEAHENKYDTMFSAHRREYDVIINALTAALKAVLADSDQTRSSLRKIMEAAA